MTQGISASPARASPPASTWNATVGRKFWPKSKFQRPVFSRSRRKILASARRTAERLRRFWPVGSLHVALRLIVDVRGQQLSPQLAIGKLGAMDLDIKIAGQVAGVLLVAQRRVGRHGIAVFGGFAQGDDRRPILAGSGFMNVRHRRLHLE